MAFNQYLLNQRLYYLLFVSNHYPQFEHGFPKTIHGREVEVILQSGEDYENMVSEEQLSYARRRSLGPVSEGWTRGEGADVSYVPSGHSTRDKFPGTRQKLLGGVYPIKK